MDVFNLLKKLSQQKSNPYMVQNLELLKWNINGIVSTGCDGSSSPIAATNQQNSVRNVAQLSQIQIIAIFEAIQEAHNINLANFRNVKLRLSPSLIVVMGLLNSFRDGNDLNLRQQDNICDTVLLVSRCHCAGRTITSR